MTNSQYQRLREVTRRLVEVGIAPSLPRVRAPGLWAPDPAVQRNVGHWPGLDGFARARITTPNQVTFQYRAFASFSTIPGNKTQEIGARICKHFESNQFTVSWTGDPGDYIRVLLKPEGGA